jgi:hypothetical protein
VNEIKALPDKTSRFPESMLEAFSDSAFGALCRTQKFRKLNDEIAPIIYRKAVRIPSGPEGKKWSVFDIKTSQRQYKSPARPVDLENETIKEVATNISFFEAIEQLAVFEKSPYPDPDTLYRNVCENLDELGTHYFKTLAMTEGIIFDLEGVPSPTIAGEVVTPGNFATEDIRALKDIMKKAATPRYQDNTDLIVQILKQSDGNSSISLEALQSMHKNKKALQRISSAICLYANFLRSNLECDYTYSQFDFDTFKSRAHAELSTYQQNDGDYNNIRIKLENDYLNEESEITYKKKSTLRWSPPLPERLDKNYKNHAERFLGNILSTAKREINELSGDAEPLKSELSKYIIELAFIKDCEKVMGYATRAKQASLSGKDPIRALESISDTLEHLTHHLKDLGLLDESNKASPEIVEHLQTHILQGRRMDLSTLPWERYNSVAQDIEQRALQYKKMIEHEWAGKGMNKKLGF